MHQPIHELEQTLASLDRRRFLQLGSTGLGGIALTTMEAKSSGLSPTLHHPAKAHRVIYLFQSGGPSQLDMFDHKPALARHHGQDMFSLVERKGRLTGFNDKLKQHPIINTQYAFARYGENGGCYSELLPHMAKLSDTWCRIQTASTIPVNHDPAMTFMQTGHELPGRPSIGAWLAYGLGSMNRNLPDFVVLVSRGDLPNMQPINNRLWGTGFLPGKFAGVRLRGGSEPVLYLKDPGSRSVEGNRQILDAIASLNEEEATRSLDPQVHTRIAQYEMAFRMQNSVPELADISDEPESTYTLYGDDARKPGTYAFNCLMARRLAERDVRFIQLFHSGWDHHFNLPDHLPKRCKETDQATAALIIDLKQRGLLDDTIVIWGGEFGRTAFSQDDKIPTSYGRDHHAQCFTILTAGGGFKPGIIHGESDEFGYAPIRDNIPVHDLHATILHQLGIHHERLRFRHQGRDYRLTDVHGHVIHDLLT